jgi:hypothetical protein
MAWSRRSKLDRVAEAPPYHPGGHLSASPTRSKADLGRPSLVQPGLLGSGLLPFFWILFNLCKSVNLLFDLNGKENAKYMEVARSNFLSVL